MEMDSHFKGLDAARERAAVEQKRVTTDPPKQDKFGQVGWASSCLAVVHACGHCHTGTFTKTSLPDQRSAEEVPGLFDGEIGETAVISSGASNKVFG